MLGLSVDERTGEISVEWSQLRSGNEVEAHDLDEIQQAIEDARYKRALVLGRKSVAGNAFIEKTIQEILGFIAEREAFLRSVQPEGKTLEIDPRDEEKAGILWRNFTHQEDWAQGARDGMAMVLPFLRKYFEGLRDQNA